MSDFSQVRENDDLYGVEVVDGIAYTNY